LPKYPKLTTTSLTGTRNIGNSQERFQAQGDSPQKNDQKLPRRVWCHSEEPECGSEGAACPSPWLAPEEFFQLRAFDTDLPFCAGGVADPNHAGMGARDETLQQDHVARVETMPCGMKARAR